MANDGVKQGTAGGQSFRRLIRYSIGVQTIVIAVAVAAGLVITLQTAQRADDLQDSTTGELVFQGLTIEFGRSQRAVRQYVLRGDRLALGRYRQSRDQISLIEDRLFDALHGNNLELARMYGDGVNQILKSIDDAAIAKLQAGEADEARRILEAPAANQLSVGVSELGSGLSTKLAESQAEAESAVSHGQTVSLVMTLVAGLAVLGTGIGVLVWLRRRMLAPLENLAAASRKLGHGDLGARVEPGGVAEVAQAGAAFNQMADEIEQQVGQMHELSSSRSRFVSSVSHELRTPITSLRGYLELLDNGEAGPLEPEQARYVKIAGRNARELEELIQDLLTLSRVQSGKVAFKPEQVNLRVLLRELKAELLTVSSERKIDIVLVDTGDLVVSGDPLRLRQAFGNLLSNSIKYSADGQAVVIRAFAVDRQAVISFVDWGVGIPRDDLPQIAEPFFRSDSSDRLPGTGLGLAITKQMVELHGGRLAVESEQGAGSTFTVYLPLHTSSVESSSTDVTRPVGANVDPNVDGDGDLTPDGSPSNPPD